MTTPTPILRTAGRLTRIASRLLLICAVALVVLFGAAQPASAHATLLFTTPAAETADPVAPNVLVLVFSEPVSLGDNALTVASAAGKQYGLGKVVVGQQGRTVSAWPEQTLPAGVYMVRWRVTGADGDLVEGQFRFGVGAPITEASTIDSQGSGTSWPSAVLRWMLLAGLTLAAGSVAGDLLVGRARKTNPALPSVEGWAGIGTITGAAAAAALAVTTAAASNSGIAATAATLAAVQAAAFAVALIANAVSRSGWTGVALLAVAIAEGIRAHPNLAWPGWGAITTTVHIAAAAVWAGTLLHVLRTAIVWRTHRGAIWWLISTYARLAIWAFAAVAVTGILNAVVLVPSPALLNSPYGRLLLTKLMLVGFAVTLAVLARRRLRGGPDRVIAVTLPARIEAVILWMVLAATAILTATAPAASNTGQQFAPAPTGPVLPLGTLAGQIGVGAAASYGQLVIRLTAPRRDDYYNPKDGPQRFTLTARLLPAGGDDARDLDLQNCGPGCYLAHTQWNNGDNLLTLHAGTPGWHGGTVALVIAWPVTQAPEQLTRAVTAMSTAGKVTVYEQVTSDTSTQAPEPTILPMDAADYLSLQPYSAGIAPQVAQLPGTGDGNTLLALGFPAEGRYIQLTLDPTGRITDEVQVSAKHITRRHLTYH